MAADTTDDQLRAMAQHRGLKLVKSRRRKPATGDYGKYGLTDAAGEGLLGIGDDGLTATADDIRAYLRNDATGSWKQSASVTPDRAKSAAKSAAAKPAAPVDDDAAGDAPPPRRPGRSSARDASRTMKASRRSTKSVPTDDPEPPPPPKPQPELGIRAARPADASTLAELLSQLSGVQIDRRQVIDNLGALRPPRAGLIVATLGDVIGCCGWATVPTIHRGPIGRLTLILVDRDHRRNGIATALLERAQQALAKAGCAQIEVMSDIAIANAHNFFRALGFEQASYRFVRKLADTGS